jgi:hypothetical protein
MWSCAGYWDNISFPYAILSPIPELRVERSDITIVILQSNVKYYEPILDPWFKATGARNLSGVLALDGYPGEQGQKFYRPDRSISVLGCAEQYQFCNTTYCTPEDGIHSSDDPWFGLDLDDAQKAIMAILRFDLPRSMLASGLDKLGSDMLLAVDRLWAPDMAPLSATLGPEHWKSEVENFMYFTLASVQRMVAEFANPYDVSITTTHGAFSSRDAAALPGLAGEDRICRNVRIRDAGYLNFNAIGLAAVFAAASTVILANLLCVPSLAFWVRRRLGYGDFSRREWVEGHVFRLQRRLWEARGIGRWSVGAKGWDLVPVSMGKGLVFEAERAWSSK